MLLTNVVNHSILISADLITPENDTTSFAQDYQRCFYICYWPSKFVGDFKKISNSYGLKSIYCSDISLLM